MHQDDALPYTQVERRKDSSEVTAILQNLYDQGERHMKQDTEFHAAITHKFNDYFGELDGPTHKKHHSWVRDKITEEEARDEFYKKIKFQAIEKAILTILGAVAMYVAVSVWNSATHDVVAAGTAQTQGQTDGQAR